MAKKPVVYIFDPKKDIMLTRNASDYLISGILSQERDQIKYFSRRLTITEFNYSNIKKEAWPIMWTTTCDRQFLIGKVFFGK